MQITGRGKQGQGAAPQRTDAEQQAWATKNQHQRGQEWYHRNRFGDAMQSAKGQNNANGNQNFSDGRYPGLTDYTRPASGDGGYYSDSTGAPAPTNTPSGPAPGGSGRTETVQPRGPGTSGGGYNITGAGQRQGGYQQGVIPQGYAGPSYQSPGAGGVTPYGLFSFGGGQQAGGQPTGPAGYGSALNPVSPQSPVAGQQAPTMQGPAAQQQATTMPVSTPGGPQNAPGSSGIGTPSINDFINRGGGSTMTAQNDGEDGGLRPLPGNNAYEGSEYDTDPNNPATAEEIEASTSGGSEGNPIENFIKNMGGMIPEGMDPGQFLQGLLNDLIGGAVGAGASAWSAGETAWNDAMGTTPQAMDYMGQIVDGFGFDPGGLSQAVSQNWMSAMDPGAWEQMAQNRFAQGSEQMRGDMNDMARRARGAGARGGYNAGGTIGNLYGDYMGGMQDLQRNVYNDTLMSQMNALQGASSHQLGQQGLDQQRWSQQLGMLGQAGMMDSMNAANDHTNFGEAMGGISNLLGGMMGGGQQAAGQGMAALAPLLMMLAGSDARLKEDVRPVQGGALELALRLRPVQYAWREEAGPAIGQAGQRVGVLAQEVEEVLPGSTVDVNGVKHVRMDVLFGLLLTALHEQQAMLQELQQKR